MNEAPSLHGSPLGRSRALPPLFLHLQLGAVLFFAASVAFHLVAFFLLHQHGHVVFPFSLNAHDRFYDFTIFTDKFRYVHTARFFEVGFPINYPAPVALLFAFFFRYAAPHPVAAFVSVCVLSFVVPFALFGAALVRRGLPAAQVYPWVATLCLLSWPVELIVDGANAEVFVWIALAIAIALLATDHGYSAACFFGLAAALKLFPFVFLALFLFRGQLGKLLAGIASFLVLSIGSLHLLGPSIPIAYRGIAFGLEQFKRNYMATWRLGENGVDHSLFALVKMILHYGFHHGVDDFSGWLRAYLLLSAVGGLLLYLFRIRRAPLRNQLLLLSIASIYFTAFSGDGTLIHLYYPFAALLLLALAAWRQRVTVPGLAPALYTLLFCVSVESFFVLSSANGTVLRVIGPMHAVGLGVLFVLGLRYPFGPPIAHGPHFAELAHPDLGWLTPAGTSPRRQPSSAAIA